MDKFSCDETAAKHLIAESDQVRTNFNHYFFANEWHSINNYDLTVNTANKTVESVVRLVKEEIKTFSDAQQNDLTNRLAELILEQMILISIFQKQKIAVPSLSVTVNAGDATLKGLAKSVSDRENCAAVASRADGVTNLANEMSVEPLLLIA
ncbi:BON domain-containing protein [Thermodesulfobacteriota bacterium]